MPISSALGSSALLPAGLGFRNVLINGDFRINQRGFTSATTNTAFGFDRWRIGLVGDGTTTWTPVAFTPGNAISGHEPINYSRIVTTGQTATNTVSRIFQNIEDVRTLAGRTVTVSFWAKCASGTPSIAVGFDQFNGSTSTTVNGAKVAISTSWARYSITINIPSISSVTGSSHYLALSLWVSAGSVFDARTSSLGIQSNTFDIWGVQLEENLQPTPFEKRPIGIELALCQRYYALIASGNGVFVGNAAMQSTTSFESVVPLPVPMRIAPALVAPTGTDYYGVYVLNVEKRSSSIANQSNSPLTLRIYGTLTSTTTAGSAGGFYTTNASASIAANAEF